MSPPINIADLRDRARRRLPRMFFDYLDAGAFSEATLRRNRSDLEALDLSGAVRRTHGGAVSAGEARGPAMPAFDERTHTAIAEKRAIGAATAALVEEGDSVLLDGGTTTLEAAADRNLDMFIGTLWRWRTGTFRFGRSFPWPKYG